MQLSTDPFMTPVALTLTNVLHSILNKATIKQVVIFVPSSPPLERASGASLDAAAPLESNKFKFINNFMYDHYFDPSEGVNTDCI